MSVIMIVGNLYRTKSDIGNAEIVVRFVGLSCGAQESFLRVRLSPPETIAGQVGRNKVSAEAQSRGPGNSLVERLVHMDGM